MDFYGEKKVDEGDVQRLEKVHLDLVPPAGGGCDGAQESDY
jgi:hypothetical protein